MSQSPFVSTRRTHPIATHGIHTVPTFAAGWIRKGGRCCCQKPIAPPPRQGEENNERTTGGRVANRTQRTRITHLQKGTRENREGCLRSTVFTAEASASAHGQCKTRAKGSRPLQNRPFSRAQRGFLAFFSVEPVFTRWLLQHVTAAEANARCTVRGHHVARFGGNCSHSQAAHAVGLLVLSSS
jgi:hypothetical protein